MIHALDPTAATFIAVGYLGFIIMYLRAVSSEGRKSRAGQSMVYLLAVIAVCSVTSYIVQFLPIDWQWVRPIEGWILAVASLGLLVSGCGTRLGRAMDYEKVLRELDAAKEKIKALETTQPR